MDDQQHDSTWLSYFQRAAAIETAYQDAQHVLQASQPSQQCSAAEQVLLCTSPEIRNKLNTVRARRHLSADVLAVLCESQGAQQQQHRTELRSARDDLLTQKSQLAAAEAACDVKLSLRHSIASTFAQQPARSGSGLNSSSPQHDSQQLQIDQASDDRAKECAALRRANNELEAKLHNAVAEVERLREYVPFSAAAEADAKPAARSWAEQRPSGPTPRLQQQQQTRALEQQLSGLGEGQQIDMLMQLLLESRNAAAHERLHRTAAEVEMHQTRSRERKLLEQAMVRDDRYNLRATKLAQLIHTEADGLANEADSARHEASTSADFNVGRFLLDGFTSSWHTSPQPGICRSVPEI